MRPFKACFLLLAAVVVLAASSAIAHAQSQGVGVTIESPVSTSASPQPTASGATPGSGSTPSTAAPGIPTVVSGTTQSPGGSGLLPKTGLQLVGLLAAALALLTVGQILVAWARRSGASSTA